MYDLDIIKINECLVVKDLLTNVTQTNDHSNIRTFFMPQCVGYYKQKHQAIFWGLIITSENYNLFPS